MPLRQVLFTAACHLMAAPAPAVSPAPPVSGPRGAFRERDAFPVGDRHDSPRYLCTGSELPRLNEPVAPMLGTGHDIASVASALVAEYNSLRCEIGRMHDHQKLITQFGFTVMVGLAAAAATLLGKPDFVKIPPDAYALALTAIAINYLVLTCLYAETIHRINVPARYIHSVLRKQFAELTDGVELWRWEQFLAEYRAGRLPESKRHIHAPLDWTRWLVFVMPILICFGLFVVVPATRASDLGMFCWIATGAFGFAAAHVSWSHHEGQNVVCSLSR